MTCVKLKYLCRIVGGGTPSKANESFWKGDIPWVSPKDMKSFRISDAKDHISLAAVAESATRIVPPASVLIVVRSGILQHSIPVALNEVRAALNQDMKALIPSAALQPEFLAYFIAGSQQRLLAEWTKEGTTVESIEVADLANTKCPVPSRERQTEVVRFLDRETAKIDDLITKKERISNLLGHRAFALATQAVLRGLNPSAQYKPFGSPWADEIPSHWSVRKLKFVATLQTGVTLGKTYEAVATCTRPYLRVANVQDGRLSLEELKTLEIPASEVTRYELRNGDVLMTEGGDFDKLGRGYVWEGQVPGCLHQNHIFAVRSRTGALTPEYFAALLRSDYGRTYFTATSQQTTNLATTNSFKLLNFPIPEPPLTEQRAIVAYLKAADEKAALAMAKIDAATSLLREYRAALISAAVTGQLDIRKHEKQLEALV